MNRRYEEVLQIYDGVMLELEVNFGTTEQLATIGVRNDAIEIIEVYPNMPVVESG